MVCLPSTTQATKFSEQRMFLLIFIAMIQQIFCLSSLLLMRLWCQFLPSWIPFEHSNFSLRLQPHSPITRLKWPPRPELRLHPLVVSVSGSVMVVVHVLLIDGFLAQCGYFFPSGASQPIGNIHTQRMWVETIFLWAFQAGSLSPLVCPPLVCLFFLAPTTSKCLLCMITTLQWPLTNVKDKDKPEDSRGTVYKIKCYYCEAT